MYFIIPGCRGCIINVLYHKYLKLKHLKHKRCATDAAFGNVDFQKLYFRVLYSFNNNCFLII